LNADPGLTFDIAIPDRDIDHSEVLSNGFSEAPAVRRKLSDDLISHSDTAIVAFEDALSVESVGDAVIVFGFRTH